MGLLDKFDFSNGHLPPWFAPLIGLTRPLATSLNALIIPAGAFTVAMVAIISPETARAMNVATKEFLHGIPEPLYYLVGGVLGTSFVTTSAEVIKGGSVPPGRQSPEQRAMEEIEENSRQKRPRRTLDPENE